MKTSLLHFVSFGMVMPGRNSNLGDYRYGFQGQELDNEIKGNGNSVNYKYRMHDPRIGRFFAEDPKAFNYPFWSPYVFSGNQVLYSHELEGMEPAKMIPLSQGGYVTVYKDNGVWVMSSSDMTDYHEEYPNNSQIEGSPEAVNGRAIEVTVNDMNPGNKPIHTIVLPENTVEVDDLASWDGRIGEEDELTGDGSWVKDGWLFGNQGEVENHGETKAFPVNSLISRPEDWNVSDEKLIVTLNAAEQLDSFTLKDKDGNVILKTESFLKEKEYVIDNKYGNPETWTIEVKNESDPKTLSLFSIDVDKAKKVPVDEDGE
jgi:RHS repeat-associated protein